MARPKSKRPKAVKKEEFHSDDERSYAKEKVPDPESSEYYHNEIDDFHTEKQKKLTKALGPADSSDDDDNKTEVLGFDDDSSEDELMTKQEIDGYKKTLKRLRQQSRKHEMASDLDTEDEAAANKDDDMPDEKAWGKKKSQFYGADVSDIDSEDIEFSGSEPDVALLEEKEAMTIQQRLIEQLDDDDFTIQSNMKVTDDDKDVDKVIKDISKLSTKQRIKLVKSESPELLQMIEEFKLKLKQVQRLSPIIKARKANRIGDSTAMAYVTSKFNLYLNYCINLCFYVSLKAGRTPYMKSHPIIGRILKYRKLIKQLESIGDVVEVKIADLLQRIANDDPLTVQRVQKAKRAKKSNKNMKPAATSAKLVKSVSGASKPKQKKPAFVTQEEQVALDYYDMMKSGKTKLNLYDDEGGEGEEGVAVAADEGEPGTEVTADGKRAITYQIEKNKGLTPHRKKENRNPRVKNRNKYRKAKIRRKGGVRENRTEVHRYGGEATGIKAGLIKSTKFK